MNLESWSLLKQGELLFPDTSSILIDFLKRPTPIYFSAYTDEGQEDPSSVGATSQQPTHVDPPDVARGVLQPARRCQTGTYP